MLAFFRNYISTKGAMLIIVLLVGIPLMTMRLSGSYHGVAPDAVAVVNDLPVSGREFQLSLRAQMERLRQLFGDNAPQITEALVKPQVLDGLIDQRLIQSDALTHGFSVTDRQIANSIVSEPGFQQDGNFEKQKYLDFLHRAGISSARFEAQLRADYLRTQWQFSLLDSVFLTERTQRGLLALEGEQREVSYLTLDAADGPKETPVSTALLESFLQEHAARFELPERVQVDYVVLDMQQVAADIGVSEDELKAYYEANKDHYVTPSKYHISHIMMADKSALQAIKQRLDQGEDFSELAKEFSEDIGSAGQGGDLGYLLVDSMEPAFAQALSHLKKGAVSGLLKTDAGWHIIKLYDVRHGEVKSFADLRAQIEKDDQLDQAEDRYVEQVDALLNLAFEMPDSLQEVADKMGLEVHTSDWFSRDRGTDFTANAKVRELAFSHAVLHENSNSERIELSEESVAVLHLHAHEPSRIPALAAIRSQVAQAYQEDQQRQALQQRGDALLKALQSGKPAPQSTDKNNWKNITLSRFDAQPEAVAKLAFSLPAPEQVPLYAGKLVSDGHYTLIKLTAITSTSDEAAKVDTETRDRLLSVRQSVLLGGLLAQLKKQAEMHVFDERL